MHAKLRGLSAFLNRNRLKHLFKVQDLFQCFGESGDRCNTVWLKGQVTVHKYKIMTFNKWLQTISEHSVSQI